MFRWVVVLGWLAVATSANAEPRHLPGPAIKHLVSGTVMHINTPLNTVIPVHYGADGSLAANAGAMGFYLGAKQDTGRWWVSRTRLCHKWKTWFDGDAQCLKLRKSGNKVFWESQKGETGTARIKRTKPRPSKMQVAAVQAEPTKNVKLASKVKPTPKLKSKSKARGPLRAPTQPTKVRQLQKTAAAQKTALPQRKLQIASLGAGLSVTKKKPKSVARLKPGAPKKAKPQVRKKVQKKQATQARRAKRKIAKSQKTDKALRQTSWQMTRSFRVAGVSQLDVLNIRKRPSEYSPIVGVIPHRARGVKIVGACQSWWCPVAHGAAKGWVNRFYLAAER